jgi:hypothetical protein
MDCHDKIYFLRNPYRTTHYEPVTQHIYYDKAQEPQPVHEIHPPMHCMTRLPRHNTNFL